MRDRNYWGEESNPDCWIYPPPVCGPEIPTRFSRKMRRGDSIYFLNAIWQNIITGQLFTLPVTDPILSPPPNSIPFNLTGCEIWYTAKLNTPDPDVAAPIELSNMALGGITVTSAVSGAFTVLGSPFLTSLFPDSRVRLNADHQVKDSTGRVSTVEVGHLDVYPDITRNTT
jgi:hypothetical protein